MFAIVDIGHFAALLNEATAGLHGRFHWITTAAAACCSTATGCQECSHEAHHWSKVEAFGQVHLLLFAIGNKDVWEVKNGSGMAAVHDGSTEDSLWHGCDQGVEEVVIADLTGVVVVERDQGLVVSILLVTIVVLQLASVAGVVEEHHITWLTGSDDLLVCSKDVVVCWVGVVAIVHQHGDVLLLESVAVLDVFFHVSNIVVAPAQLSVLSDIVDSNHDGSGGSAETWRHEVEVVVNVHGTRRRELRHLREGLLLQHPAHLEEGVLEAEILSGVLMISIGDVEEGGGEGTAGSSSWIRKLETSDVADIRGGLRIAASADHAEVGGDCLLGLFQ
mmetsp:Transcript_24321/g.67743  ORF Transcript_24321/g.67743 Transcript_24321/m.67743 type:complete len:333 (+) Transcript_24321:367-1365(+)